jgi:predicted nucleic acid-binding protein
MTVDVFLDTNIIIYAVDTSTESATKRARAREILQAVSFGISTQVLQEFYNASTRRLKVPLPAPIAARWVERLSRVDLVVIDVALVKQAIAISSRFKITYFDAAILAAAEAMGAPTVYTEDLSHGQNYGPVRVINPFRPA